ncbi:hypothetical protein QQF64_028389 [Cirrhinus molitorella]|uniref:Uncharacterized protein n=1 Tax=Cirrhinus molitorella TaxID=172907 RepID=A0ABR3N6U9_9TELE
MSLHVFTLSPGHIGFGLFILMRCTPLLCGERRNVTGERCHSSYKAAGFCVWLYNVTGPPNMNMKKDAAKPVLQVSIPKYHVQRMVTVCKPRKRCEPGYQLRRTGRFDYNYYCEPCQINTYNDAEDSTCKLITKCDGGEIFPGNQTHNARCASSVPQLTTVHAGNQEEKNSQTTHSFMVACLVVTVLTFLVFIMYTAFQTFKYKMHTKISHPYTQRIVLPSDTCSCKLSKEEQGEENDSNTEVSDVPCKHDFHFP